MAVRFSPAYSPQSNGNVERYHCTLTGRIRTLRQQVQQNYNIQIPTDHPLMAWAVRRSACLINRFLIRAEGYTSYHARWGHTHTAALCGFGETVMYMVPTFKQRPKLEPKFFRGTWLGKCTSTGASFVGVAGRAVLRARTVRRLAGEARYDKQRLGTVKGTPWNPSPLGFQPAFLLPPLPHRQVQNKHSRQRQPTNMAKLRRRTEQLFLQPDLHNNVMTRHQHRQRRQEQKTQRNRKQEENQHRLPTLR